MITKPQWLKTWQAEKAELFRLEGFPTRKTEDWKYTPVGLIAEMYQNAKLDPATKSRDDGDCGVRDDDAATRNLIEESSHGDDALQSPSSRDLIAGSRMPGCYHIVIIDAKLNREYSHFPEENKISISTWSEHYSTNPEWLHALFSKFSSVKATPFTHLNHAYFDEGLIIKVADHAVLDKPIQVIYINNDKKSLTQHFHNLIYVGKKAHATFLETHQDHNVQSLLHNQVTNIFADENAELDYIKLSPENEQSLQISSMAFLQEKSSHVKAYHFGLGGRLVRDDLHFSLNHKDARCELYGFYALKNTEHYDCHSRIDHASSATQSQQIYKGIIDGKARGVFNGKIVVHPTLSKISAQQRNNNLLLAKTAEMNTKPELEIYSEDVSCSHGATIGDLDAKALFYLRSRGISEALAKELLTQAFALEIVGKLQDSKLSEYILNRVMEKLAYQNLGENRG